MKLKKYFRNFILTVLFSLASIIFSFALYLDRYFHDVYFEQLIYNFLNMESLNIASIGESIDAVGLGTFIFGGLLGLPLIISFIFKKWQLVIRLIRKEIQLFPISANLYISFILVISSFFKQI